MDYFRLCPNYSWYSYSSFREIHFERILSRVIMKSLSPSYFYSSAFTSLPCTTWRHHQFSLLPHSLPFLRLIVCWMTLTNTRRALSSEIITGDGRQRKFNNSSFNIRFSTNKRSWITVKTRRKKRTRGSQLAERNHWKWSVAALSRSNFWDHVWIPFT